MNTKNLTLNILDFVNELTFIKSYYKYLLSYCIEYDLHYDGNIAVEIIKFTEKLDEILEDQELLFLPYGSCISSSFYGNYHGYYGIQASRRYNHQLLKIPRYKMYHVLERHGY